MLISLSQNPSSASFIKPRSNTLARYAIVVDDQKWEDMYQVFTEDTRIHFTFLGAAGELLGISYLVQFIKTAAQDTASQHAMSIQSIVLTGRIPQKLRRT
jgi:hypothetical protein